MSAIQIVPMAPAWAPALEQLFEACASSCFCRYWHFEGTKNEWLARSAHEPRKNREEQRALAEAGALEARGLVAMEGAIAVGWMKVSPRGRVGKLRRLPVYRSVDLGDDEGVWAVACFLVRPDRRRAGIARALVAAGGDAVRAWGGRALEAYPRRSAEPMHAEELWMGPESLFVENGFLAIHDVAPYPILRKTV